MAGPDDLEHVHGEQEDDVEFATIATAPTTAEARKKALEQLRKLVPLLAEDDVEFFVVEEGTRGGFFGRGRSEARVEARVRPCPAGDSPEGSSDAEVLREFIRTVTHLMGLEAQVFVREDESALRAEITGEDLGLLIGRHGSTIDALQYLAAIVVNGDRHQRRHIVVDAEGYRERREAALIAIAERSAQRVAREGVSITLKPMTAAERKVIHLYLREYQEVQTFSEGSEPFRSVVIAPRV